MILCEWDAPEGDSGQSCVHLYARILSMSFSSVSIFSVCCYSIVSISMVTTLLTQEDTYAFDKREQKANAINIILNQQLHGGQESFLNRLAWKCKFVGYLNPDQWLKAMLLIVVKICLNCELKSVFVVVVWIKNTSLLSSQIHARHFNLNTITNFCCSGLDSEHITAQLSIHARHIKLNKNNTHFTYQAKELSVSMFLFSH